jgi:hypothetical protein
LVDEPSESHVSILPFVLYSVLHADFLLFSASIGIRSCVNHVTFCMPPHLLLGYDFFQVAFLFKHAAAVDVGTAE